MLMEGHSDPCEMTARWCEQCGTPGPLQLARVCVLGLRGPCPRPLAACTHTTCLGCCACGVSLQVAVDNYTDWIEQVALLTIQSLGAWQWARESVFYLLGLWSRLVSSTPYLKGDSPSLLDANVPKIIDAYIKSR